MIKQINILTHNSQENPVSRIQATSTMIFTSRVKLIFLIVSFTLFTGNVIGEEEDDDDEEGHSLDIADVKVALLDFHGLSMKQLQVIVFVIMFLKKIHLFIQRKKLNK